MNQKLLFLCGMISPLLFVFMTILGAALWPGYNHISDTVSELFSPTAPNKPLLDVFHIMTAVLSTLFGIGVLRLVCNSEYRNLVGMVGAGLLFSNGIINIATATIFPQDAWGSAATFSGEAHKILVAVLVLFSIFYTLLLGIWFQKENIFSGFMIYSFITVGLMLVAGIYAFIKLGSPVMGLTERIAIIITLQWMFVLAFKMFIRQTPKNTDEV